MANIGADGSSTTISFVEETTFGTTPTNPVFRQIRSTGNGLAPTLNKSVSDEISALAGVTDVIPTQGGAEGDVNFEPSYGEFMDTFLEHAIRSTFDDFGIASAGVEKKSMTLERIIPVDGTPNYFRYPGCRANTLAVTLDAEATSPITGTFNIMGLSEDDDTAIISGSTYVPANTNPVMSMPELRNLTVTIGGVTKTACFKTLSFTINNNLRSQQGKCTDTSAYPDITAKGIGYGRREITLDVAYYFNELDFYNMFQANTSGSFSYILSDGTRGYKITFPNAKILESSIPIEGNDADVVQTMSVQALIDPTTITDMTVEKIGNLSASTGIKLTGDPITPSGLPGTFYWDGTTQENGENVYFSVNGAYAIWYDGADTLVTSVADVGAGVPVVFFERALSNDPVGSYAAVTGTGTLDGAAYDPLA
jgi:hypothetical protein